MLRVEEFIYNASSCDEDIFAFVYPSAFDGVPDLKGSFRKNQKGQFVVYMCPLTVYAESLGLLADAVQTSVHESSHHAVAYTDDVAHCLHCTCTVCSRPLSQMWPVAEVTCPQSQYIWMDTAGLCDAFSGGILMPTCSMHCCITSVRSSTPKRLSVPVQYG